MIQIQSGSMKNRRLGNLPKGTNIRPILARMKKSLFDILQPRIVHSLFMDLFAGTGSVGLEALSRGADRCTFVEIHPQVCRMIQKNLDSLGLKEKGDVIRMNALGNLSVPGGPFHLIFAGPPYKDKNKRPLSYSTQILESIEHARILHQDGWVMIQHQVKETLQLPEGWTLFRQKVYGDTKISFFRRVNLNFDENSDEDSL